MNRSKCQVCGSKHTVKNGLRKCKHGTEQKYICKECGYQFTNSKLPQDKEIWKLYQENKQTIEELSCMLGTSASTIKRRLRNIKIEWEQPPIFGAGYVHIDATYWGRNSGILVAIDSEKGNVLYLAFINHEKVSDYIEAIDSIESRGYEIKGIIIDGVKTLFKKLSAYKIQMCQFHMRQIVKRYLTNSPKLLASRALNEMMHKLTEYSETDFQKEYLEWKTKWKDVLDKKSELKNGRKRYRHQRLRSAMLSIDFYLPYLFTFQKKECDRMPNTNNKIEGTFTDLKKNLNNHSGMSEENRKRFISGFFLALT